MQELHPYNTGNFTKFFDFSHCSKKFCFTDFFSICDQFRRNLQIYNIYKNLVKKSFMENFIFCPVSSVIFIILFRGDLPLVLHVIIIKGSGQNKYTYSNLKISQH